MPETTDRTVRPRHYLMCEPRFFEVTYSINPWMDVRKPVDADIAVAQWERLRDLYVELGHQVSLIEPVDGLPDMVFTANGATVLDGRVLLANFRYEQRRAETEAHRAWFDAHSYPWVTDAVWTNEGQGDFLMVGDRMLAGTGFRSDPRSHEQARELFGCPVVSLTLVDPRYYHLDTALSVLSDDEIMYYPAAFSPQSQAVLRGLYPDAVLATAEDAEVFGLNVVSDGRNVILPQAAARLIDLLRQKGFHPIGVDMSELMKAGGAVKCCSLELHG
jgi:N-dimethylarginine dimethylaminohydrolase